MTSTRFSKSPRNFGSAWVIQERIAHRVAIPAFAGTKIVAVDQGTSRVVGGAVLAARDACFYDPLSLTRPI
jgi:hypothetical protein